MCWPKARTSGDVAFRTISCPSATSVMLPSAALMTKSLSSLDRVAVIGRAGELGCISSGADVVRVDDISESGFLQPAASASESVAMEIAIHGLFILSSLE